MIYKKILEFQKKSTAIKKDGKNPHFKSSYVTLNSVLDAVKQPLNDAGVVILQLPTSEGLQTILWDTEDDTKVECFMPYVATSDPQKLGSNNTYNRRYSLVTLLGLEDTDDDGNADSSAHNAPKSTDRDQTKESIIPDGMQSVMVTDERHGTKNGKYWQRVKTGDGAAWNNDKNDTQMEVGETYTVIVKGGNILQVDYEDLSPYND